MAAYMKLLLKPSTAFVYVTQVWWFYTFLSYIFGCFQLQLSSLLHLFNYEEVAWNLFICNLCCYSSLPLSKWNELCWWFDFTDINIIELYIFLYVIFQVFKYIFLDGHAVTPFLWFSAQCSIFSGRNGKVVI